LRDKMPPALVARAGASPPEESDARPTRGRRKPGAGEGAGDPAGAALPGRLFEDACAALVALGLTRAGAIEDVRRAMDQGPSGDVETLVRRALALAAPKPAGPGVPGVR
jgi:hypothetical protein